MPEYLPPVKVLQKVSLRDPYLVAAGPGTANVGLRTVDYLRKQLAATHFAEISPQGFFPAPYALSIEDGIIKLKSADVGKENPQNNFYYHVSGGPHDIVLFVGDTQPLQGKGLELARTVMDVARGLSVNKVFVAGAFITEIHHQDEPNVLALVSNRESLEPLRKYGIQPAPPINPAFNIVTWLMTAALEKGIDVACLVAPIPFYVAEEGNGRACRALVRILTRILEIDHIVPLGPWDQAVTEEDARMAVMLSELRKSTDEGVRAFLEYLDSQEEAKEQKPDMAPMTLPESLKFIADLYQEARMDKSKTARLAAELRKLSNTDRLQVLRALGPGLLELMGGQIG